MKEIIINPVYYPYSKKWGVLVVDPNNPGTHKNYDIIFNSDCNYEYWDTEEEAREYGKELIKPE